MADVDPSLPPDSHRLLITEGFSWSDFSGNLYTRDDSLKESTNPKNHPKNAAGAAAIHISGGAGGNASNRFSGNLRPTAAPIIGLPGSGAIGHSSRRQTPAPAFVTIFPPKATVGTGGRKPAVPEAEPSSPKVSCFGKVLSERERRKNKEEGHGQEDDRSSPASRSNAAGCCMMLRREKKKKKVDNVESPPPPPGPPAAASTSPMRKEKVDNREIEEPAPAPALGAMRKLSSGRKGAAWSGAAAAAESDVGDDAGVARSGPLDRRGIVAIHAF